MLEHVRLSWEKLKGSDGVNPQVWWKLSSKVGDRQRQDCTDINWGTEGTVSVITTFKWQLCRDYHRQRHAQTITSDQWFGYHALSL